MKAMTKSVEEMVSLLGDKYGFDKAEAFEFIMPGGEITRGRPSKPKKKVVNKTEMVEDVIKTIMEGAPQEAEAVPAQAEPVIVAAVVEAAKEKKKAAPRKKKAEAAVVEVAAVAAEPEPVIVAVAAATEEKADAPEGGLKGDAPLKKKAAPKKKADAPVAARKVAAGKPDAVVEAPKAVVEAPKPAPKAVVEELSEEEVEEEEEEVNVVAEVSPVGLKSVAPESDEESTDVKEWTWEVTGETYLKCCDNNCDILNCDCTGVVYSVHTQEPIGRWNGTMIEDNEDEDDE